MNLFKNKNNVITYTVNKDVNTDLYISVQNGEVVINAPWYMASNQIQKIVEEKRQWIINKINEYEMSVNKKIKEVEKIQKINEVKVLGKDYILKIDYKNIKNPNLTVENNNIKVVLPNKYKKMENNQVIKILIDKMYQMIAKNEIEKSMEKTRLMLNIAPEDYMIQKMNNMIAKCTQDKKIIINPNIAMYSRNIIDYIVLHEYCHLKYKNHTQSFYNMIKTYMPDYEKYTNEINGMKY